jgi:DNA modification methylase
MAQRKPPIMTTTLWDFPSQQYGDESQGSTEYAGATPAYIIWNLLQRYTKPKDLVVDPMAGSGTTLDVARELGRRALGYDVHPSRKDIFHVDARKLPLEDEKADFAFVDPPYSTHIDYGDDPRCIGKLDAAEPGYYEAMERVISEIHRILRPGAHMALYVSDSFRKGRPFCAIGMELFVRLTKLFEPVDIIAVKRYNKTLSLGNYHKAAQEENFFLRGFNYLFIMRKAENKALPMEKKAPTGREEPRTRTGSGPLQPPRRDHRNPADKPPRKPGFGKPGFTKPGIAKPDPKRKPE